MLIFEPSWNNLRGVKVILRGFGLVSGLNINLCKSSFLGVNVEYSFRQKAASFLCCSTGSIPFYFLGIKVGAN